VSGGLKRKEEKKTQKKSIRNSKCLSLNLLVCVCVLYKRKNKKLRKKSKEESLGQLREKGSNKQKQRKERQEEDPLFSLSLVSHPFFVLYYSLSLNTRTSSSLNIQ